MLSIAATGPVNFNQLVSVTIESRSPKKPDVVKELGLKIEERVVENNEREFRIEISDPEDLQFLYAEGISRSKYQVLADKWKVRCEYMPFFKDQLLQLLRIGNDGKTPAALKFIIDSNNFVLEIVDKKKYYDVVMPIELYGVTGDALLQHLMNNVRSLKEKLKKMGETTSELRDLKLRLDVALKENSDLYGKVEKLNVQVNEERDRAGEEERLKCDAENDLQIKDGELEEQKELLISEHEKLQALTVNYDILVEENNLHQEVAAQLQHENNQVKHQNNLLKQELGDTKRQLRLQSDQMAEKNRNTAPASISLAKVAELELAMREKDDMISKLTDNMESLAKELESTKAELAIKSSMLADDQKKHQTRSNAVERFGTLTYGLTGTPSPYSANHILGLTRPIARTPAPFGTLVSPSTPLHSRLDRTTPTPVYDRVQVQREKEVGGSK